MELKFKNITRCSEQLYKEFLKFHNKKFGKKEVMQLLFMLFAILYIIVFNIKNHNFTFIIIIVMVALIAFFIYKVLHREKVADKELKSPKIKNKDEIIYNFYNMYFEVIRNNKKQRIWYQQLHKIYQDNLNFYFYLDETHALLIDKKGFIKGNLDEFKDFIQKRCILQYRKEKIEKFKT